jgi:ribosomal subunit interface protein
MQLPLQVNFRDMDPSEVVEARVRERAAKLDRFADHIMSCRVMIESHHKHHHKGNVYHVRIDITAPGREIVVSRDPGEHHAHEDVYVAVRDAFDAAERQLQDFVRQQRGDEKVHETLPHGEVIALFPELDYGTIRSADGREVYFHRNSVVDGDFDQLQEGAEVRFVEEQGDKGPQASTVHVVGKHHPEG